MNLTKLNSHSKKVFIKYKADIQDIILFGSYTKGKVDYNDLDILIIFKKEVIKDAEVMLKNDLNDYKIDLNSITVKELEGDNFIAKEGLYLEGFSLVKNKKISSILGFSSVGLIKYDISKIKGSNRIRFYYALSGRGKNKGILDSLKAKKLSDNIIIADYNIIEKIKEFLDYWKVEYTIIPMLVPKRLVNILL